MARLMQLVWSFPTDLKDIYLQFGIDLSKTNGDSSWELALPANIVVDRQNTIRYISADPDYTVRPEPEEVLDILLSA